jgi:hypothetical protein
MRSMKRYYNIGTRAKEDFCYDYVGMDSYKPNGTVIASFRCQRCHNHVRIDCDKLGHYVECSEER